MEQTFQALEYGEDQGFDAVEMCYRGSEEEGWEIIRNGQTHLQLGPGYVLLRTLACGICSTDLARHHLPFPLPQITGHEVLVLDEEGRRSAVEINASHLARGQEGDCRFCNESEAGMDRHCPERLVLGIHDLPGGFAPWILAPRHAVLPLPESLPEDSALLLEPFAAAMRIEDLCVSDRYDRIAVLGTGRLGQLVVAAYSVLRRQTGLDVQVTALTRHPALAELARELGAEEATVFEGQGEDLPTAGWDLVIDTTGSPSGLELALRLAAKEVHVKSTHGQPVAGLQHMTELVVDELSLEPMPSRPAAWSRLLTRQPFGNRSKLFWTARQDPPRGLANRVELVVDRDRVDSDRGLPPERLQTFDYAVADTLSAVDWLIRPRGDREASWLRPMGSILLDLLPEETGPLAEALRDRGLHVSASRCGDMDIALHHLADDPLARSLGSLLVRDHLPAAQLPAAFERARAPDALKVAIHHPTS